MHDLPCLSLRCAAAAGSSGPMQSPWRVLAVLLAAAQAHARAQLCVVQISHGTGMTHSKFVTMSLQHVVKSASHTAATHVLINVTTADLPAQS
jgi:hypothetical protein